MFIYCICYILHIWMIVFIKDRKIITSGPLSKCPGEEGMRCWSGRLHSRLSFPPVSLLHACFTTCPGFTAACFSPRILMSVTTLIMRLWLGLWRVVYLPPGDCSRSLPLDEYQVEIPIEWSAGDVLAPSQGKPMRQCTGNLF